ncbi:Dolichyl-phosphate-mannose-protein mannosyltransferase-domain-containing protein [Lipomyces kononenkoae]|uniref:Dolichyl-phosphate-mannose-protein mannosyltransferase-domain-containing protein n=1 Tax=Lipomyces kononenkoae TaxID=34357 RepID=A0ACC3T4R5_LIPKO
MAPKIAVPEKGAKKVKQPTAPSTASTTAVSSAEAPVAKADEIIDDSSNGPIYLVAKPLTIAEARKEERYYNFALFMVTILSFWTRFYMLYHPDQVVFDEVHFGKFASYYLQRTYFFDVHPPFGKLLFALVGWLVGYDGSFLFENIGDGYVQNKVPYLAYRALPALLGSLTVPVVFLTMKDSGYSLAACLVSAGLVLFDNGHITQTRLILLDATLIFSMTCALYSYVKFMRYRNSPFGRKWWKWLLLTGLSLACTISTKYVGVFAFVSIGLAVIIDLWNLLDVDRGLSLKKYAQHFIARAFALIVMPFMIYLLFFQIHFWVLSKSGPGDDFMSPEFQETLGDNEMALLSKPINYYDTIDIKHKDTGAYLHSHPDRYPLRYDDGRISSQGQQVTGYPHKDANNNWVILPTVDFPENDRLGHPVNGGDVVQLYHTVTGTYLLTHDVASPYYPTNQEFTTVSPDDARGPRHNDTLFEIRLNNGKKDQFRTKGGFFKLIHVPTKVAMWTHTKPLPEWGYGQQEINGNKNSQQVSNTWLVDEILDLQDDRLNVEKKKVKHIPFIKKWLELQIAMFRHNNALTSSHPYSSLPPEWPFMLRGVSFWTKNESRAQIYLVGNPLGWWFASCCLAVLSGVFVADQLTRRRRYYVLAENVRNRLYNSAGFFLLAWAAHYFPFYIMGRQLFLHHYLPAHLISALAAGALLDFFYGNPGVFPVAYHAPGATPKTAEKKKGEQVESSVQRPPTMYPPSSLISYLVSGVIIGFVCGVYWFFKPFTYGDPGLSVPQVLMRKWMNFDLHFAK